MRDDNTVVAFTDGSCYPNPNGSGGWAFTCFYRGESVSRYGCLPSGATNNSMELTAILRALQYVPAGSNYRYPFTVYTDSQYAKNVLTKWALIWTETDHWVTAIGQPIKNSDLIKQAFELVQYHSRYRDFSLKWIKGHSGVVENEIVDKNASSARINQITNWKSKDNKNASAIFAG